MKRDLALIFDLDGTMVSSMSTHLIAWQQFAIQHRISFKDDFLQRVAGKTDSHIIQEIWQKPLTLEQAQQLNAQKQELYDNLKTPPAIDGIVEFIAKATQLNIPWAIGSGASYSSINSAIKPLNLLSQPNAIVSADDGLPSKPDPATFINAAKQLGYLASSCIVFEDSYNGLLAAQAANMRAVAVGNAYDAQSLALPHVIAHIQNYHQLLENNFLEDLSK